MRFHNPSRGSALLFLGLAAACSPAAPPRNVVIVSIDTLRADRLGCYGYERPTSPHIDALAEEGVLFENAYAPSPWTLPSHASLFTGLYPRRNGATGVRFPLAHDATTLAERLLARGYATAAVVTNSLLATNGLERGFQFHELVDKGGPGPSAAAPKALEWLAQRERDRPFFLFVHFIDPHSDYTALEENQAPFLEPYDGALRGKSEELYAAIEGRLTLTPEDFRHLSNLYDGGVRQVDGEIGKLVAYLRDAGLIENTLVVVTSDHGEEFGDHGGVLHGLTQYEELVRIPLILRGPELSPGRRVAARASLVDVVPTCLDFLGLPIPEGLDGTSLLEVARGGSGPPPRRLFFEADLDGSSAGAMVKGKDRAVLEGHLKLHLDQRSGAIRLYDLERDPGETRDVREQHPERVREMEAALLRFLKSARDVPERPLTDEDLRRLRELGYAGGE